MMTIFSPEKHYLPCARYFFNKAVKNETESVGEFVSNLRNLAQDCEFRILKDELIRGKFVFGSKDESRRKKLLLELTLSKAIEMAQLTEQTRKQLE